jgi:hypothetical protein
VPELGRRLSGGLRLAEPGLVPVAARSPAGLGHPVLQTPQRGCRPHTVSQKI